MSKKGVKKKTTKIVKKPNVFIKKSDSFIKVNTSNAYGVLIPPDCSLYFYSTHRKLPVEAKEAKITKEGRLNFDKELLDYEITIDAEIVIPIESIESFKALFDELLPKWKKMKKKIEEEKVKRG